jgi:hypothetical protein
VLVQECFDVVPVRVAQRRPEPRGAQVGPENVTLQPLAIVRAQCIDGIPLPAFDVGIDLAEQFTLFL